MPSIRVQRYLVTGLLTFIPLWVTWLVFKFAFGLLAGIGQPLVQGIVNIVALFSPAAARALDQTWLISLLALVFTLLALYLLGWFAHRLLGLRVLAAMDAMLERFPLVNTIYGGTKKLMAVLQSKPQGVKRVVLIDFPQPGMKAVGFVTRVLTEEHTGRELAAVYVPTTPNPTSGYLEIVPVTDLTPTDWSMDQAMAFIISGGAISPDILPSRASPESPEPLDRS